ncbi:hypothetical protein EMCRGX_G025306 [Ephydatia muelleri]
MKRSNSAPLIAYSEGRELPALGLQRRQDMSNSNMSLPADCGKLEVSSISPTKQPTSAALTLSRISSPTRQHRVEQLKMEEGVDQRKGEEHHEREVKELFRLNQSWEKEMKLEPEEHTMAESMDVGPTQHSFVPPSSPVFRMVRSRSLTPTSPGSGRTHYSCQRSLSPVNPLRPSCLSIKRRREAELEDMDMSPGLPSMKRLAYGYSSPLNSSPCVSPLTTNGSPFNHTHSHTPRKLYSYAAEQSPFVSPSSAGIANPFAFHYDGVHNCDSNSSNGSTTHSPQLPATGKRDSKHSLESLKVSPSSEMGIPRSTVDTLEVVFDVPTPLSPKNLQFRHRPLQNDTLPSPVPHLPHDIAALKNNCIHVPSEHFYHDFHLSPFSAEAMPQGARTKALPSSSSSPSNHKCYRQSNKPEPLRQPPGEYRGMCSSRMSLDSPLSKRAIMDDFTDQRMYHSKADYLMAGPQAIGLDSIPVDRRKNNFEELYGARRGDSCSQLHPI